MTVNRALVGLALVAFASAGLPASSSAQTGCDQPPPPIRMGPPQRTGDVITRLSVRSDGSQADSFSGIGDISSDGRYAVIWSNSDLIVGDEAPDRDCEDDEGGGLFVVNIETKAVKRLQEHSLWGTLSGDGSKIAYDNGGAVYIEDVQSGNLTTIDAGGHITDHVVISDDGTAIVYTAQNSQGFATLFWQSTTGGAAVPVTSSGNQIVFNPDLSSDGNKVVFDTRDQIVAGDGNGVSDVHMMDMTTQTLSFLSVGPDGIGDANSEIAEISGDGRFVVFQSSAHNFPGATLSSSLLYRKNLTTGDLKIVGRNGQNEKVSSHLLSFSEDGKFVAFDDVFGNRTLVRDIATGAVDKVIKDDRVDNAELSGDGSAVIFDTQIAVRAYDTNGQRDVYLKAPRLVTCPTERTLFLQSGICPIVVDSNGDDPDRAPGDGICETSGGACTLRAGIQESKERGGKRTISFDIPAGESTSIVPQSPLPTVADFTTIDATTQPGYTPTTPQVEIDGRDLQGDGLVLAGGGSTIKGFAFNGFVDNAAVVFKADASRIDGCLIGLDMNGTPPRRKNFIGVEVLSSGNHIGGELGNVISANSTGIKIGNQSEESVGNEVDNNLIGTDTEGMVKMPNNTGVLILNGRENLVGINDPNIISGNSYGIRVAKGGFSNNILDNLIGTDASGMAPLGNTVGVQIEGRSNELGLIGYGAGERAAPNTISGNLIGVRIEGSTAEFNVVTSNYIGTGKDGLRAADGSGVPNGTGIRIVESSSNSIGRDTQYNNVIAGNDGNGIEIIGRDQVPRNNAIDGNHIGVDSESEPLGNGGNGILVRGADDTDIGRSATNFIGSNGKAGIRLEAADGSTIEDNRIGVTFATSIGNGGPGVVLADSSKKNRIGLDEGNVIGGNNGPGVLVEGASNGNIFTANHIGTRPQGSEFAGTSFIPNVEGGIVVTGTAQKKTTGNQIGVPEEPRNVISDNSTWGVIFKGAGATDNKVQNNWIGLSYNGMRPAPNGAGGVLIDNAPDNLIGGDAGAGNVISGNGLGEVSDEMPGDGVRLRGAKDSNVYGNRIGTDAAGASAIPNKGNGVTILDGAGHWIGGMGADQGNVISGNLLDGILVDGRDARLNKVFGNRIGTDVAGSTPLPNGSNGVHVAAGLGTTIGGRSASQTNVISGNAESGVLVTAARRTSIQGNYIGTNHAADGVLTRGNFHGVAVMGAKNTTIGGREDDVGNVISGNEFNGVFVEDSVGTEISTNYIGTDLSSAKSLPNNVGIFLLGTGDVLVGGPERGDGNVVSGNTTNGIEVAGTTADIKGNYIGANRDGSVSVPNGASAEGIGVWVSFAGEVTIGGTKKGRNVIAFNTYGIVVDQTGGPVSIRFNEIRDNKTLGIDLGRNGATPNDALDVDTGPNGLQNFPEVTSAEPGSSLATLSSTPNTEFLIDFYASAACDSSGFGEGTRYLTTSRVTTDGNGNVEDLLAIVSGLGASEVVTATATKVGSGETSEFSACQPVSG